MGIQLLLVLHLIIAAAMIAIVLLQKSEGGALGIGGGGGGAGGFLTGRGTANLLTRITAGLALAFFCTSLGLTMLAGSGNTNRSRFEQPASGPTAPTTAGGGQQSGEQKPAGGLLDSLKKGEGFQRLPSVPQNQ